MNDFNPTPVEEEAIDLKQVIFRFLRYWYLFVICVLLALAVAWLVNRYTQTIYRVDTTVLLEEQSSPLDMSFNMWGWYPDMEMIENEKGVLMSHSLIHRVSKTLDFEVSYFGVGRILTSELYRESPFTVVFDTLTPQPSGVRFNIVINSNLTYTLEAKGKKVQTCYYGSDYRQKAKAGFPVIEKLNLEGKHHFGEVISGPNYNFKVILNNRFRPENIDQKMYFTFNDPQEMAKEYSNFNVELINKESSIVKISMDGLNQRKTADFLNALTKTYMERSLQLKNQAAATTIQFIERQMLGITDSLQMAESDLQQFRKSHKVMNLDAQSEQVLKAMEELEKQKAALVVSNMYYEYVRDYLQTSKDNLTGLTVPSSMGIDDPVLAGLIGELTMLYAKRTEAQQVAKEKNPIITSFDQRIQTQQRILTENVNNILNNSQISLREINNRIIALSGRIKQLPETQRMMFGMERKFKLNDAIYTLLLEKRAEAQITMASNMPDNEVIDIADPTWAVPVKPNRTMNYAIAFMVGMILPLGFLLGKDYLNYKILDRKDIEKLTNIPIIGQIIHSESNHRKVVADHPRSFIAESFRQVRTTLHFLTGGSDRMVILVTSGTSGEGKSFTSLNIATVFAMYGRKTLVMGYDLRKPGMYPDMNLSNTLGITTCLINQNNLHEVIQTTGIENLDFMAAGPIPPNPAELIASAENDALLEQLKGIYDVIILDTPPVGLVTDAWLLMKHATVSVLVTRQNYTPRKLFESVIEEFTRHSTGHAGIILNDYTAKNSHAGHGYGYGYTTGYDYGYYSS